MDLPSLPWLERHQVALYVAAIAAAGLVGWTVPGSAALGSAISPVLGLLLFATFLAVPFTSLGRAFADLRFLTAVLVLNFVVVPVVVLVLSRVVAGHEALLLGVLLVLLTPCVDYVIVFSGLAGGAADRLLAASPLLMLAQMLLLPLCLTLFAGAGTVALVEVAPFVEAFLLLIALPLAAAAAVQWAAPRAAAARRIESSTGAAMVPLMAATLFTVVASQVRGVGEQLGTLVAVVPLYVAFLVVMVPTGLLAARLARLDVPATRALAFSGATRNSLVVLPLALALPEQLALTPLVVVTQTLVELVGMVVLVRLLPRLTPARAASRSSA
ncbi:arsenic resistance protein [Kocuria dechangensis]|uniref:Arsenic resistance protein n=1 Tax=Kocuria dechangensis TaxID=1176249 RepID=A0A917GQ54_9MICC|nr:bile acid:sodium symporter [Kocuria dechangensis]GGG53317.1 arsenic resistance protein [Kocuria dechangensis]